MAKMTMAAARKNKNLTQQDVADLMGVSRQSVADWESGKKDMRPAYFMAFCQITGVPEDDILLPEKFA